MNRIIGVDVDLTVCPSDDGWREWLANKYGYVKCPMTEYNFSHYYPHAEDPFEYWRSLEYSQFQPLKGSVEKLEQLSTYFDIVFISAHKGQHSKSKYYWLEEHFPFNRGVILTKEKFLMNSSVVAHIDDRKEMLEKFDLNKRVLFSTSYTQNINCNVNMTIESWSSFCVKTFCDEYLI